jgi:hypothetical protein
LPGRRALRSGVGGGVGSGDIVVEANVLKVADVVENAVIVGMERHGLEGRRL